MIYTDDRYKSCMDALLPIEWEMDGEKFHLDWACDFGGHAKRDMLSIYVHVADHWEWWSDPDEHVAGCVIDRAARVWLRRRGIWLVRRGETGWAARKAGECAENPLVLMQSSIAGALGFYDNPPPPRYSDEWTDVFGDYGVVQLEAMLAVLKEGEA